MDESLFQMGAEVDLHAAWISVSKKVGVLTADRDYLAALSEIAALKGPVDAFFDKVMVMAEEERIKNNRLALLTGIARMFGAIADFGRISA